MANWYSQYESQCWYKNTFLVNRPNQISRAIASDREWNNIDESGCNFTCLAMICGLNPAYLASAMRNKGVFRADRKLRSRVPWASVRSKKSTYLVWDKNRPIDPLTLKDLWHPARQCFVSLTIARVGLEEVSQGDSDTRLRKANAIIASAKKEQLDVICGHNDHSRLVAGKQAGHYFLWDPSVDEEFGSQVMTVQDMLNGRLTLDRFFSEYDECEKGRYRNAKAEFWKYKVDIL
jgi:hypothetical protein